MKIGRNVWIAAIAVVLVAGAGVAVALLGPKPKPPAISGTGSARIGTETVISTSEGVSRGSDGAATQKASSPTSGTTAEEPVTSATMQGTSAKPAVGGKRFAYVRKAWKDGAKYYVSVDFAELLTGDAATKAAAAHGVKSSSGYYIANDDTTPKTVELEAHATVRYVAAGSTSTQLVESSPEAFVTHWANGDIATLPTLPYFVTIKADTAAQLDQIYLP